MTAPPLATKEQVKVESRAHARSSDLDACNSVPDARRSRVDPPQTPHIHYRHKAPCGCCRGGNVSTNRSELRLSLKPVRCDGRYAEEGSAGRPEGHPPYPTELQGV